MNTYKHWVLVGVMMGGLIPSLDAQMAAQEPPLEGPAVQLPTPANDDTEALPPPVVESPVRAILGVVVVDVNESNLRQFGLIVPRGAVVTQVAAGSPAADANLMVGAVIVAYDGQRVGGANDLVRLIAGSQPDQDIELTYYLGRRLMRQTIRLGAAPANSDRTTLRSPSSIPAPSDDLLYPNGPRRPALGVLQDLVEGLGNRGTGSAAEDRMREQAELRQQIVQLQKTMEQLLRRVERLEARLDPPAEPPRAETPPADQPPPEDSTPRND